MKKRFIIYMCLFTFVCNITNVEARFEKFEKYFKVDMSMELPNYQEYLSKIMSSNQLYDRGYTNRFQMSNVFNKQFSSVIREYGQSESRIKNSGEDDLITMLQMLPRDSYQYIGPLLHETVGISDKVLNLPGIKETKNKFPENIADRFKGREGIEFLSPALYFLLIPDIWERKPVNNLDEPQKEKVQKPKVFDKVPDHIKIKAGIMVETKKEKKVEVKKKKDLGLDLRTLSPSLTSSLTSKDVEAFVSTIDDLEDFANKNNKRNLSKLIVSEMVLDVWEDENGTALMQNSLKDIVNPCQRLVLKVKFSGMYDEFSSIVIKQGFTPEEWAYTCDKTIRGFRVTQASPEMAYAVKYHRHGYYDVFYKHLPQKWRDEMKVTELALSKMYAVFKEDVETVKPFAKELNKKFLKNQGMLLVSPIFY